jgi:hypothetical protein
VDTVAKQGFTIQDRVIYGHKGQSLQDLIAIAQNDPNISPKLDADHPVVIKLAPIEYGITSKVIIPAGLVIQGEDQSLLHFYYDAYFLIAEGNSFKNLQFTVSSSANPGYGLIRIYSVNRSPKAIIFNQVSIGGNVTFIARDNSFTDESTHVKVYFNEIIMDEGILFSGKDSYDFKREVQKYFVHGDHLEINNSQIHDIKLCSQDGDKSSSSSLDVKVRMSVLNDYGYCMGPGMFFGSYLGSGKLIQL